MTQRNRMADFGVQSPQDATPQEMSGEAFPLPTGEELFAALSPAEQTAAVGAEAAELVREGGADLKDFVGHSELEEQPNFLTQKPAEAVEAST